MFERFVKDARVSVTRAQGEARDLGADSVGAEHLLLALAASDAGAATEALHSAGLDRDGVLDALRLERERSLAVVGVADALPPPGPSAARGRGLPFTPSAKLALERSLRAAMALDSHRITSGHVLLGVLRADVGTVPRALEAAGVDRVELVAAVEKAL